MLHTIENDFLRMTIDDVGAQMMSITAADGTEYLWNGDSAYWGGRAPNLFPYVGRLTDDTYTIDGQSYEMKRHGFSRRMAFETQKQAPDKVAFRITATEETKAAYPWEFAFSVAYELDGVHHLLRGKPGPAGHVFRPGRAPRLPGPAGGRKAL